jgi:hypothetical protein
MNNGDQRTEVSDLGFSGFVENASKAFHFRETFQDLRLE